VVQNMQEHTLNKRHLWQKSPTSQELDAKCTIVPVLYNQFLVHAHEFPPPHIWRWTQKYKVCSMFNVFFCEVLRDSSEMERPTAYILTDLRNGR